MSVFLFFAIFHCARLIFVSTDRGIPEGLPTARTQGFTPYPLFYEIVRGLARPIELNQISLLE
jgi:hypothetical protein